nr:uncharacterized protein LOC104106383 [Nicotiana tomentosiformis]
MTLPSNTEKNPKETIKVVSLRSGKTLADLVVKARPEVVNKQAETLVEKNGEEQTYQSSWVQKEIKEKVLTQMPAYAKFLKEILSSKRKLEETNVIKLNTHCSAILQNKISQKFGDPESFTIPCSLASEKYDKALRDFGASINLIPLFVFRKLEGDLGVIKSIPVSPQLADQTTILHEGIIEDILVRVDKFVFPAEFCGGYGGEQGSSSGQLMLRVGNEKVVFQMKRMTKYPSDEASAYSYFKLDAVGELAKEYKFHKLVGDTLERCITQSSTVEDEDPKIKKKAETLETEDHVVDDEKLKEEASKPNV